MLRPRWATRVLLGGLLLTSPGAADARQGDAGRPAPRHFDYLTIEANDGASSGGHAALRFDHQTYHFQYQDGLLRLSRRPTARFLDDYNVFGNRAVRGSRVAVDDATWRSLRQRFEARRAAQDRQLDLLAALREDRALLEAPQPAPPAIPGLGFFSAEPGAREPSLLALRSRLLRRQGQEFLASRRDELLQEVRDLRPWPLALPHLLDADTQPAFQDSFARAWHDRLAALAALEVLAEARALEPGALRGVTTGGADGAGALAGTEARALAVLRTSLEEQALDLAGRRRPDFGRPLLVTLARIAALERSLAQGRLLVLDAFADDAEGLEPELLAARRDAAEALLREAWADHRQARLALAEAGASRALLGERLLHDLEASANRALELEAGLREGAPVRFQVRRLVPERAAPALEAPAAALPEPVRLAALGRSARQEAEYLDALRAVHRYHLLRNNCATALFALVEEALGGPETAEAALAGRVDPEGALSFVPFLSAAAVDARWRVVERWHLPSHRQVRVAALQHEQPGWRTRMREISPLSARSYIAHPEDGAFLFFTDGAAWPRPLLGAANLAVGLGQAAWGVLRLPLDGGRTLGLGLRSAGASLPELVFLNLRKGSYPFVAPDRRVGRRWLEDQR